MSHPVIDSIKNMLVRCILSWIDPSRKMQIVQVAMLADETAELPYIEPYGFTSCPRSGAEAVAGFLDGDRSHGIVLCIADRRYRLTGLAPGEVAIYDDVGQSVVLSKSGIVVRGGGKPMKFTDMPEIDFETPLAKFAGDVVATKEISDQGGTYSMSSMRGTFNVHDHNETQSVTGKPNQTM